MLPSPACLTSIHPAGGWSPLRTEALDTAVAAPPDAVHLRRVRTRGAKHGQTRTGWMENAVTAATECHNGEHLCRCPTRDSRLAVASSCEAQPLARRSAKHTLKLELACTVRIERRFCVGVGVGGVGFRADDGQQVEGLHEI